LKESPYFYPGTTILKNKRGLRDQKKLAVWERLMTSKRLVQLMESPILGHFDLLHLQRIHWYLFQDVYEWAGQLRTETISKPPTVFCLPYFLRPQAERIFAELRSERYLTGLDAESFSDRAAYYLAEINMLHPFREGNGRAQREFIRCLGLNTGYEIDWYALDADAMLEAMIESAHRSRAKLVRMIQISLANEKPNAELIRFYRRN
jgi:cell filamentation protein